MIRFPVWFVCDGCGDEGDGDVEFEGAWGKWKRYVVDKGWKVRENGALVLCGKCSRKKRFRVVEA